MFGIRDLEIKDIHACWTIVSRNWGDDIADQARTEITEMFCSNSKWPPHYIVAVDENDVVLGFAGYKSAWLMSNTFELIWINVDQSAQGQGIGKVLTERRILEITNIGGTLILMMTQKPEYFTQFGFNSTINLDGWELMYLQIAPVTLASDRSR